MTRSSRIVQTLREELDRLQRPSGKRAETVAGGVDGLNRLLPGGAFRRGTLAEWLFPAPGSGAHELALRAAWQACRDGGALVIVDPEANFYPPAAAAMGIDAETMILVRPANGRDCLWAWDQALRCTGVGAVLGSLTRLDARAFRRLQLAAKAGGNLGMLLRPATVRGDPSWAEVRLLVEPLASTKGRRWRVERVRCRGKTESERVTLEVDDETGDVHLVSELAPAAARRRSSGAS